MKASSPRCSSPAPRPMPPHKSAHHTPVRRTVKGPPREAPAPLHVRPRAWDAFSAVQRLVPVRERGAFHPRPRPSFSIIQQVGKGKLGLSRSNPMPGYDVPHPHASGHRPLCSAISQSLVRLHFCGGSPSRRSAPPRNRVIVGAPSSQDVITPPTMPTQSVPRLRHAAPPPHRASAPPRLRHARWSHLSSRVRISSSPTLSTHSDAPAGRPSPLLCIHPHTPVRADARRRTPRSPPTCWWTKRGLRRAQYARQAPRPQRRRAGCRRPRDSG